MLDLRGAWADANVFFVTEDTALGRSIAREHRTYFVDHFALGQVRMKSTGKMLTSAWRNLLKSFAAIKAERPDYVISTGAGSAFFTVALGKLSGSRVIVIDSLARFETLSTFARFAGPIADVRAVQSEKLTRFWPDARVFDPIRIVDAPRPAKENLLVATVGATLPFDRMVSSVAELKSRGEITEDVFIQTGIGGLKPAGIASAEELEFSEMQAKLKSADIAVCHGGTGSLITALQAGCRVIAMPRLSDYGEHYDRHQDEITDAFAARGLIHVARSTEELALALRQVRTEQPRLVTSDHSELSKFIRSILDRGQVVRRSAAPTP